MSMQKPEDLLIVKFPNDPGTAGQQQREMYESNAEYRKEADRLWGVFKKGITYDPVAIKHLRQYWQKQGWSSIEIRAHIFARFDLPYDRSDDPVENADFPEQYRRQMSKAYRYQGHKNESRIEFSIRWL